VATGEFKNTTALQVATLKTATVGRYLRFVAKSEVNGRAWSSAAEIGIEADADVTAIDAIGDNQKPFLGNAVYNLSGQQQNSSNLHSGIYVVGGKKIAIK
jgi:beta-galactosidase